MLNTLKTFVLLSLLGALCVAGGGLIGEMSGYRQTGLLIGVVLGFSMIVGSFWFSEKIAIASAGAQPVSEEEMPRYHEIMQELCHKAEMPMPKLYVSPNPQPNAFATGRSPKHSAVCITEGLVQAMDWQQIRGVLAHELCHIRNRDVLICSVAAAVGTFITYVAQAAMWGAMFAGGRGSRGGNPYARLVFALLAPIAAMLIQLAVSRSREFQADASAARLMGEGESLARALERLGASSLQIPSGVSPSQASAYIVNPLKAQAAGGSRGGGFTRLFSTHPPIAERVRRLEEGVWFGTH